MDPVPSSDSQTDSAFYYLVAATILVGVASGLFGMLLAMLLHAIQHIAYGYSLGQVISDESFLEGVRASSSQRRVLILMLCGLIAGLGWWALYRYGQALVSIAESIKTGKRMPYGSTIIHALLQIVTIALGSPLGREVAPREIGAVCARWISSVLRLNQEEGRIMLACGAGAGLAAVYNVPLGGALFTLEVLLCSFSWSAVFPALATSAIAVVVSWIGLGNEPLYQIPDLNIDFSLVVWAMLFGPIFGYAAFWFIRVANKARTHARHDWHMPIVCFLNFSIIGCLAIYFPALLGNGKSPAQIEFDDADGIGLSFILLVLRSLICWSSLRAGAQGGLLTPSLANGALLAVVLGGLWRGMWPHIPLDAFALVGAVAFLAAAQKMPITAIVLIFELTRINLNFLIPILFAVSGSIAMARWCTYRYA
ncbi:chloride channel protein [Legionella sp. CNM-4043-24]|uniref:chloride channel protein n=1 Tax=Legionella sp. CNM-4043-24 TaxID=3421646 RepID=UPI00403ADA1C